ncbi:MAG TPA: sigma-70 family RNA polymerase sigma factor [Gemmatimonadales bacterium]|nr:sigma-70 family RNA polymerase sigma factor [Gemmatimonadales bacterium]
MAGILPNRAARGARRRGRLDVAAPTAAPLDINSVATLWARYRSAGDPEAREMLLRQFATLVHFVAHPMAARLTSVPYEELVSAGNLGLLAAVNGYDPGRGLAFSTYAVPRIRGAILDDLRRGDRVPRSTRARTRRLLAARATLAARLQRSPSPAETATELGLELDAYWRWCDEVDPVESGVTGSGHRGEWATSPEHLPDYELLREERRAQVRLALKVLPERERRVLALYFFEELTLREIGVALGVTESRVSQLRQRALGRLREALSTAA